MALPVCRTASRHFLPPSGPTTNPRACVVHACPNTWLARANEPTARRARALLRMPSSPLPPLHRASQHATALKNACAGRLRVRVAALVQGSERKGVAVGGGVQLVVDQSDGARGVQLTSWTGQLEHCDRHWTGQLNAQLDWTGK